MGRLATRLFSTGDFGFLTELETGELDWTHT